VKIDEAAHVAGQRMLVPTVTDSQQIESDLKNLVLRGKIVAFVGAGVSTPPGQAWQQSVATIAARCDVEFKPDTRTTHKDLREVIDTCIAKNRAACDEALRQLFPVHIAKSRPAIPHLTRLKFKAIVTTNFDPWLRMHIRQADYSRYWIFPDLSLADGIDERLFYIHGIFVSDEPDANIGNLVFGENSFSAAYKESLLPGFLLNLFVYHHVLFIGFNPTEDYIAAILHKSIGIRKHIAARTRVPEGLLPRRFILQGVKPSQTDEDTARFQQYLAQLKGLGIEPVFYDDRDGHVELEKLLYGWVEQGNIENRPPPFSPSFGGQQ
jgi:hypothetical protein